jgi:hypothetical protein
MKTEILLNSIHTHTHTHTHTHIYMYIYIKSYFLPHKRHCFFSLERQNRERFKVWCLVFCYERTEQCVYCGDKMQTFIFYSRCYIYWPLILKWLISHTYYLFWLTYLLNAFLFKNLFTYLFIASKGKIHYNNLLCTWHVPAEPAKDNIPCLLSCLSDVKIRHFLFWISP